MKKTISLKLDAKDYENMQQAIKKFNKNQLVELNQTGFIVISLRMLCNRIADNQPIPLEFK